MKSGEEEASPRYLRLMLDQSGSEASRQRQLAIMGRAYCPNI
jgi:hypothetical protein